MGLPAQGLSAAWSAGALIRLKDVLRREGRNSPKHNPLKDTGGSPFRQRAVTGLHHTIDGFTITFMGGVFDDPLSLASVFFMCRSGVMEMAEHSPTCWRLANPPNASCERPIHTIWYGMGMV